LSDTIDIYFHFGISSRNSGDGGIAIGVPNMIGSNSVNIKDADGF